jgi:hypothetical protein
VNGRRERRFDLIVKYGSDIPRDERVDLDLADCGGVPLANRDACGDSSAGPGAGAGVGGCLDRDEDGVSNCSLNLVEEDSTTSVDVIVLLSFGLGSGNRILPPAPDVRDSAFIKAFARVSCICFVASFGSAAP